MSQKVSIIYVIGAARSGTTLLDIILGNNKEIFSAGELNRFTEYDGLIRNARDMHVRKFWQDVNQDLLSKGFKAPIEYFKMSQQFENHKNFWNILFSKSKSSSFKKYAAYQKGLFEAIFKNANNTQPVKYIIDSSKYPLRGYFLSKIFSKSISFIYIKRNPSDVATSFQKKNIEQRPKNLGMAHLYMLFVNSICEYIIRLLSKNFKTSTIYYERLIFNTVETLSQIENNLNIDLGIAKDKIKNNEKLAVGYLFEGNRLRLEEKISFSRTERSSPINVFNKILMPMHKMIWYRLQ